MVLDFHNKPRQSLFKQAHQFNLIVIELAKGVRLAAARCLLLTLMSDLKAPTPIHLLRSHSSPIASIFVSRDNERIYSGDASGHAVLTSTRTLRAITSWKAHEDGFLGIEEWGTGIITSVSLESPDIRTLFPRQHQQTRKR